MYRTTQKHDDGNDEPLNPTEDAYLGFYQAFDHFNAALFGNELPAVMFTMSRKSARNYGYFSAERFGQRRGSEVVDEISLNPQNFHDRSDKEIISTLVHEQCYLWQFHFGKYSRGGYHNKEWGAKMIEIGLMPSHTDKPGGKTTGQQMTHYIIEGGPFETQWQLLSDSGYTLDYQDRWFKKPDDPVKVKVRYACPGCSIHAWGKPDLRITCTACKRPMK